MRTAIVILASAALSLALPQPGSAAPARSRPVGDMTSAMTGEVADCIVKREPQLVVDWLATLAGSSDEQKAVRRKEGSFSACFGSWLAVLGGWAPQYDYSSMRVKIVRSLIRNRIVAVPEAPPAGLQQAAWFSGAAARNSANGPSVMASDLGFCLAKTNWPAARSAVLSAVASPEERAALAELTPLIGGCVPPGVRLRMDRPRLRAILEETLYHATGGTTAKGIEAAFRRSASLGDLAAPELRTAQKRASAAGEGPGNVPVPASQARAIQKRQVQQLEIAG